MTILKLDSSISGENSVSRVLTRSITDQLAGGQSGRERSSSATSSLPRSPT